MKHYSLRTMIAIRFALIVLVVVALISIVSNILINRQFEKYVEEQQNKQAVELAQNLSYQYDSVSDAWNLDFIHGLGMYALNEGYIVKLYDVNKDVVWDAQHHDMTLCYQMMNTITLRMQENRPELDGNFVTHTYDLQQDNQVIGYLDISYYSPYNLNENEFQFIKALNRILIAVGIISLLGAVVMGLVLANSITKPIVKTVEITKQISEGDYNICFQDGVRTKELYGLTQAVSQMAESLGEQENLRKRLTSDVAHELRTPIANVLSYLEAIIDGVWESTAERLQNCYDELERISKLVSDLERLRQAENDNLSIQKTEVDLLDLAQSVLQNFETQLAKKNLRCTVDGDHTVVSADRGRIQQVITNLVSNAIKYSNEEGKIHILLEDKPDAGIIRVEDNGIGIAEKDIQLIFERFYRADKSRNRKTGGAGIGLTIAKAIIQAHGGKIMVESQEGHGSSFIVTLPKK